MKIWNLTFLFIIMMVACSEVDTSSEELASASSIKPTEDKKIIELRFAPNPNKNAYFGDLHVHTANSFDAYTFGTISSPADAYRYAQGQAIPHPTGYQIQLSRPLDFYAVTDHAVFLGLLKESADTSSEFSRYDIAKPFHNLNDSVSSSFLSIMQRSNLFRPFGRAVNDGLEKGTIDKSLVEEVSRTVWQETIKAADDAYIPGIFTTFAGYEYTSSIDLYEKYLHRNVIFRDTKSLPARLFSRLDSQDPEKLWDWMDRLRNNGVESLAIPHNSNISGGATFSLNDYTGGPIDEAYAKKRALNEPLTEITQVKGTSETHPLLSKNDEWAAFEAKTGHEGEEIISNLKGSYVRDAYLRGLTLSEKGLTNPYKFGLIGSSDTHVGGGSDNEEVYFSKIGLLDGTAELRGSIPFNRFYGAFLRVFRPNALEKIDGRNYLSISKRLIHWSASGLAGVWAEENTREAIYDAFRRKETFATSGPRIKVRFFAGYDLENSNLDDLTLIEDAYAKSIPMGGTLNLEGSKNPTFLVWAISDPLGAPLQRIQIIKGWLEDGEHKEKVYDVACSDGLIVDKETNRCPDNGASVDLRDCSISADSGARELKNFWQDPEFLKDQEAFYYSRVLENPVCRWSTWDAIRNGKMPRSDIPSTMQERAWSSPVWYQRGL
ncbi:MAG: DUF3604 domain-containing protein [SAR86 cluster bacterium]|nr:DUF3604 domain-containing protein [SAR86 cluster bacterium]